MRMRLNDLGMNRGLRKEVDCELTRMYGEDECEIPFDGVDSGMLLCGEKVEDSRREGLFVDGDDGDMHIKQKRVMSMKEGVCEVMTKKEDERFNPYEDNSGTTVCLKQEGFIVISADTRHSSSMSINSREMSKIYRIGDFFLTATGFYADGHEVYVKMKYEMKKYENDGRMSIHSAANMLSKILYSKRFFPYYAFCTLSGFEDGKPHIYEYDPLGSFGSVTCICNGSGKPMIQPLLDSFIDKKNWHGASITGVSEEDCVKLVAKAFNAAAERDVKTKDGLEMYVLRDGSVDRRMIALRRD
ncbi:proteasome [Ordospora pajunii]|jgi:20S proteasome subunit beta 6|uniref:proteasome n=1 Tax=Ordospora pajunii TaxID=3039483 RepID=UPI0029528498|nr:proteasome [Ordospora pajunii]KAH9411043.1 proteasome [Ordospora pajunii]